MVPGKNRPWSTEEDEIGELTGEASSVGSALGALVRVGASAGLPTSAPHEPQNRLLSETSAPQAEQ